MEIIESVSISQSLEKIWNFWLPVSTDVQWREEFTKAEWASQPPYGVGSTGTHYHKNLGAIPWMIIRWEDGRYFEFVHRGGKLKGSVASYRVEPENDGSRVTIQAKIVLPFIMRIPAIFMRGGLIKSVKDDLQKLKNIMEK